MAAVDKVRCDACPVMCFVAEGRTGACDRYANENGRIVRCDPVTLLDRRIADGGEIRPFLSSDWDGSLSGGDLFVSGVGAGTTYPDFKPAPFIVSREIEGVDTVTVVTEAIYSYCGAKVKIDTDRHIGDERAVVRAGGEPIGMVMTAEYGSQMLSLGGVDHLTGGSKPEGRATCDALMRLCNGAAVELQIDGGSTVIVQAGQAPIVDGAREQRMRVGCGSATIGMFAAQWQGLVDEVVVVDDHITGVVSEHQAGKVIGWPDTGIRIKGRRSTPGRYFQVAEPGLGWGGTDIVDPLSILGDWLPRKGARPGLTLLMVSTTGEHAEYFVLGDDLVPQRRPMPADLAPTVDLIAENCEPALCTVMFCAGAGGSLRAGATTNPVRLTRAVQSGIAKVTLGGAEAFLWPGGGITVMVDVLDMPADSFGHVPTPAIVAPLEFTMPRADYLALGGYGAAIRPLEQVLVEGGEYGSEFRALGPKDRQDDETGPDSGSAND
ncbi:6-hydroxynicotinate reductase [Pseudooceanicola algae]|uniref:6-hydroxynicotinate reductase n=1 Tax=Pseudooceanicola algae TaxID=1537215 RepID=A0A418SJA9_9RHOB|nr:6-hydroxynicotinate reductase [Pseudooceanicola algae]QPM90187.1 6-hydroxynicotinate reductase [Pseudooceanicola algae]